MGHRPELKTTGRAWARLLADLGCRMARRAGLPLALVAGLGTALTVASAMVAERGGIARAMVEDPLPKSWVAVRRPLPIYDIVATPLSRTRPVYEARRNLGGGGREDLLTFGDYARREPYLRVSFYRVGTEAEPLQPLLDDLGRLGTGAGATVIHAKPADPLSSRFGPVETAELGLGGAPGSPRCLGFRAAPNGGTTLRIAGLFCGAGSTPIGREVLACVINGMDIVSAGDDRALQRVFVEAERRRGPACGSVAALEESPPERLAQGAWIDAHNGTLALKGRIDPESPSP